MSQEQEEKPQSSEEGPTDVEQESPEPRDAGQNGLGITPETPSFTVIGPIGDPVQFYSLAEKDPDDKPPVLNEEELFEP